MSDSVSKREATWVCFEKRGNLIIRNGEEYKINDAGDGQQK